MQNDKLQISVTEHYDATKGKDYNNDRVAKGWTLKEYTWTEDSVKRLTTQHGISCNEYKNDHRVTESWKATHNIMLDFDNGIPSVSQLLADQKGWLYDSYIYSSQNHQKLKEKHDGTIIPKCDRIRVFIPLNETIADVDDLIAVESYFKHMYPTIDQSFLGRARYFAHGTTEISSFKNSQGPLKWRELPGLDKFRKAVPSSSWRKKKKTLIRLTDKVLNANQIEHFIIDVKPDTPIYCPYCGKSKQRTGDGHNAVIKINNDEMPFLFCSSCKSRDMGNKGVYNFHVVDGYIYRLTLDDKLVFIDTLKSKYMAGCFEEGLPEYVVREQGGTEFVKQFCLNHEIPYPKIFPRARFELIFNSDKRAEFEKGYVNKYSVTELLTKPIPKGYIAKRPKYIGKIIDHVMAYDKAIISRFDNNMGWFFQTRKKMITSFLMQGVEGTGKGFLFSNVFQPIFGMAYCAQTDQDAFGTQFNSFLTDNVLVLVNEVSGNFSASDGKNLSTIEKMKIAITDEHIQIEGKNKDRFNGKNVCSFLFATNRRDAITLSENDRRFNVAPRQETILHDTSWWPGYQQLLVLVEKELQEYVWYMKQYKVDESLIGKVIDNEPKRVLQTMSKTNMEVFFDAVGKGDLTWLNEQVIFENSGYDAEKRNDHIKGILFKLLGSDRVSGKDLCDLYNNVNGKKLTTVNFGRIAAGHLGASKSLKINGSTLQGFKIDWKMKDEG